MHEDNACVCVVDDDKSMRESLRNLLRSAGFNVQTFASAHEFLTRQRPAAPICLVLDVQLPGLSGLDLQQQLAQGNALLPIIFITGYGDIPMTVRAMKAGAIEFLTKPFRDEDLLNAVEQAMHHGRQRAPSTHTLAEETSDTEDALRSASSFSEIVGHSAALRRVLQAVETVAPTDATVLLLGETGTGKELIARAIHKRSKRSARAFIRVNCAAIPSSLLASELFGHEKGAFTGAVQRRVGRFEAAHGGTIFLDEIGDLPAETQIALLRVLQEREFERIGSSHPIAVDVRVLAATNRDLHAAVAAGTFRQDLWYRLNVFPLQLPALRERVDDIPLLVEYLIERYAKKAGKKIRHIEKQTLALLQAYQWPGNIRELQNVVERAVILCDDETFSVDETWVPHASSRASQALLMPLSGRLRVDKQQERAMIEAALAASRGRVSGPSGAASTLGIPRQTLESKIRRLGINTQRLTSAETAAGEPPLGHA